MSNRKKPWETKPRSELTEQELAAWDREIEADFQRVKSESKKARRKRRAERHIGSPWKFYSDAVLATKDNQTALTLALYIYHRHRVCNDVMVTLVGADLVELKIKRRERNEALLRLQAAGLIRRRLAGPGKRTEITLLWQGR